MTLDEIRRMPIVWPPHEQREPNQGGAHESVMRSFHIVAKVKELLKAGAPHAVILEVIEDLENGHIP